MNTPEARSAPPLWVRVGATAALLLMLLGAVISFGQADDAGALRASDNPLRTLLFLASYGLGGLIGLPHLKRILGPQFFLLGFALFYVLLSAAWSDYPVRVVINDAHYLGMMLVAMALIRAGAGGTLLLQKTLLVILSLIGVVSALTAKLLPDYGIDPITVRWQGITNNPNHLGAVGALIVWAALSILLKSSKRSTKILCLVSMAIGGVSIIGAGSMTAMVSALLAGVVIILLGFWSRASGMGRMISLIGGGMITTLLLMLIIIGTNSLSLDQLLGHFGRDTTLTGRTELWSIATDLIAEKPIFGWSFDSLATILDQSEMTYGQFHNGYLDLLVRGGVIGLGLAVMMMLRGFYVMLRLASRAPQFAASSLALLLMVLVANVTEASIFRESHEMWEIFMIMLLISEASWLAIKVKSDIPMTALKLESEQKIFHPQRGAAHGVRIALMLLGLGCCLGSNVSARDAVEVILPPLAVAKANLDTHATPVTAFNGVVYTANVEPAEGEPNGYNLRTTVRAGRQAADGTWSWSATLVEPRTLDDIWHTEPSIVADRDGYLHIAYNMHNMPWQYSISAAPGNSTRFLFKGDPLSLDDIAAVKRTGKTPFIDLGHAAIPGNEVTYPAFFTDREGVIYVTYRYALHPKREFHDRVFAGGIARYDTGSHAWQALGFAVPLSADDAEFPATHQAISHPFAASPGWWVYHPRLWFDRQNTLYLSWFWREGTAGGDVDHPSFAMSRDGGQTFLRSDGMRYDGPITVEAAENFAPSITTIFAALSSHTLEPDGTIVIGAGPGGKFQLFEKPVNAPEWLLPTPAPYSAQQIVIEDDGTGIAVASGPRVLIRSAGSKTWKLIYEASGYCFPKLNHPFHADYYLIHASACDGSTIEILRLNRAK